MEFLQLQYFFDSARTENFAKTAEKYLVPPSSVSASVKRLEKELGCKLFDRQSNKITLNENGRRLQRSLSIVFDELEHVKAGFNDPFCQRTKIKLLIKSIRSLITDAIIEYHKTHPNVYFETIFDMDESNTENYDLIIDEQSDCYVGLNKFELCSKRLRMLISKDYPLFNRSITLSQLHNQRFVTMGKDSRMHKILLRVCKNAGFTPNIVMETNDAKCFEKCIAKGMGIGLSREHTTSFSPSSDFAYLNVTDFEERQTFYGYFDPKKTDKVLLDFIDFLKYQSF